MAKEEIIKGLQAVNEHISKHFNEGGAWMAEFIDMAIKELEQTRWIPVSEKPQEGRYLCTYEFDGGKCIDFGIFDGDAWYIKPLAYMPLPTPYKESDENETN